MNQVPKGRKTCLIIVDAQYDFMPGGALAVNDGDNIVQTILDIKDSFDLVVATQDWHPQDHCSFEKEGGMWPVHCVQKTRGAELHDNLKDVPSRIFQKATTKDLDSYSGFGNPELLDYLKSQGVTDVAVCGLATDYCVRATALDAREAGFETSVVFDAARGVAPETTEKALKDFATAGIEVTHSYDLVPNRIDYLAKDDGQTKPSLREGHAMRATSLSETESYRLD